MPSFTTTTHESATIARAGMGGTVAIVRRLKDQPEDGWPVTLDDTACGYAAIQHGPLGRAFLLCPTPLSPGKPVWVKEGWWFCSECGQQNFMAGANRGGSATGAYCVSCDAFKDVKTDPAITMPREFARFTLTPETVRVCRVQEVTDGEMRMNGAPPSHPSIDRVSAGFGYQNFTQSWFAQKWTAQHGPAAWNRNDWAMVAMCKIGGVE